MNDDHLLEAYGTERNEEAFRALVERYAGLVYHTALRRVGSVQMSEDITQAVFIALSRKAGRLRPGTVLSGWLYRATQLAAMTAMRTEARRQRRELETAVNESPSTVEDLEPAWERISARLDEALDALPRKDREAVLARFFEGKCHREVARALGVSEAAAKVRVSRAVAKLRMLLVSRGVLVPSATLMATLSAYAAKAAPAGLAKSVTLGAATSGSSGSAASLWMAERVVAALAWGKAKTVIMAAAVLLVSGGAVTVAVQPWRSTAERETASALAGWDRSTPKRTLYFIAAMLSAGDAQRVAEAVQCGPTDDPKADAAVVSLVSGQSAFRRALIARFGEEAVEGVLQKWSLLRVPTEGLDQARERISGQFATLEIPGRSSLRFTLAREGWRLLLPDAGDTRSLAQFHLAGTIMLQLAAELETGKDASPDETLRGLQTQLSILK